MKRFLVFVLSQGQPQVEPFLHQEASELKTGISAGSTEEARAICEFRVPLRPWQKIHIVEAIGKSDRRLALSLEKQWERAYTDFRMDFDP